MWSRPLRSGGNRGGGPSLKPFHKWRVKSDLGGFQGLLVYLARRRRRDLLEDLSFLRGLLTIRWFSLFPCSGIGQVLGLGLLAVGSMRCWLSSLTYMCEERPSFPLSLQKVSGGFYPHIKELCSLVKKFAVMWFGYLIHFPFILVVRCGSFLGWTLTSCSRLTPLIVRMAIFVREGRVPTYRMIAIPLQSFLATVVTVFSMDWAYLGYLLSLGLLHLQLTSTGLVDSFFERCPK